MSSPCRMPDSHDSRSYLRMCRSQIPRCVAYAQLKPLERLKIISSLTPMNVLTVPLVAECL